MKRLVVSLVLLLLLAGTSLACVIFYEVVPQPSSRNARMTVYRDGKPLPSARLSVRNSNGHRPVSLDGNGSVTLRDLPMGKTCLAATDGNKRFSELCLVVSASSSKELSNFGMTLEAMSPWVFSPETMVDWIEQAPPSVRVQVFKVTVLDANDSVIPNAEIQIYKPGTFPQNPVKIAKTNEVGRFEASMEPGTYTIVFRMGRFKSELLCVEIARDGKESELRETLQAGSDCDW